MTKILYIRLVVMLTMFFGALSATNAADRFYIEAANIEPGETTTLAFQLDNEQTFYGFQADIRLPEGLEIQTRDNGKAAVTLSSRCDGSFTVVSNLLASGVIRLGALSTSHVAISGNSGALLYMQVQASEDFTGGTISLNDILFVGEHNREVALPNHTVDIGTVHNDRFYIEDFKIAVGETRRVSIILDNETAFAAFQTNIYLPEGINFAGGSLEMTSRGGNGHALTAKSFSDGRTRIICFDSSLTPFTGNSGALVSFEVTATKDAAETSEIRLANQLFSVANGKEYVLPNSSCTVTTERAFVQNIQLNHSSIDLVTEDTEQLIAIIIPSFASTKDLEWSSSNPDIAAVSATGVVTALSPGHTIITATAVDGSGVSAQCEVSVTGIPVSGITLNRTTASLKASESLQLSATVNPPNAYDKNLTWKSSASEVASIDDNGNVTALVIGDAIITATSDSNPEISAQCVISVVPTPVSSITLSSKNISLQVGGVAELTVDVLPTTATNKEIVWSTLNATIASIDESGHITALALGSTTVRAAAADGSGIFADCVVNVVPTAAGSISINETGPIELKATHTIQLTATVGPEDATDKSVTWSSSDANIASVDASGLVTARSVGECKIIAANSSMQTASVSVSVIPTLAETITVIPSQISLRVGQTSELAVTVRPETTTDKSIRWSSSDTDVVAVLEDGQIKALSLGEVVIRATALDGSDVYGECKVIVKPTPVTAVSIVYDGSKSLYAGDSAQLSIEVTPDDATDKTIRWQVQNANILSVDENGLLTAVGLGEAWVSATAASGVSHFMAFQVVPTPVSTINLTPSDVTLRVGDTAQIEAEVLPTDATDKEIYWSSLNPSVASVNNEGLVTANSLGSADILATAADSSNVQAICKVTVEPTPATGIKIDQTGPIHIKVGETQQLTATVLPADATDKAIIWSSDAPESVSVDANGVITCHALGKLKITATISAGISDFVEVDVQPTLAEDLSLNRSTAVLKVGNTIKLEPIFTPSTTTNKSVSWHSSDSGIASVSEDGTVLAESLGECEVTCRSLDGSNLSAICRITVGETVAESISINPRGPFTLNVGESIQLTATVGSETATDKSISWISQTCAVSIDQNGLATALLPVKDNWICATNSSGQEDYVYITVLQRMIEQIDITPSVLSLKVGETQKLTATVYPENAWDKSIVWTVTDADVADVDAEGNVIAKSIGTTTVTASATDGGGAIAYAMVSVVATPVESIIIESLDGTTFKVGEVIRLNATVSPESATDKTVKWISRTPEIVEVDENAGRAHALQVGKAVIVATAGDISSEITLTVEKTLAENLILTNTGINMQVSDEFQLEARIYPETTTDKTLVWTTTNPDIVTVDNYGKLMAIAIGETEVSVSTTDGSDLNATIPVWVNPTPVENVQIEYDGSTLIKIGDQLQLSAKILPTNATDQSINWFSDIADVLSINQNNGLITAVAPGKASVWAVSPEGPSDHKEFTVIGIPVSRIDIEPGGAVIRVGESIKPTISIFPENATDKSVTWDSNDESIASVSADGTITGLSPGRTDINVRAQDGSGTIQAIAIFVEPVYVESIELSPMGSTILRDGQTLQLSAKVLPENATNKSLRWFTNADYRATVDESGLVTAHSDVGVLDVYAQATDGSNVAQKIMLTIERTPVEAINLHADNNQITVGGFLTVVADVLPALATDKSVRWSVSDESVLRIQDYYETNCVLQGIAPGSAYVMVTSADGSEVITSYQVTVNPIMVQSISLPEKLTLAVGETYVFNPEILPENASDKNVNWTSSNTLVGMVAYDGTHTFISYAQGETTVTAQSCDGSNLSASCVISVVQPVTSIKLNEHELEMKEKDTFQLLAELEPIDATDKSVMWHSSNPDCVSVDDSGLIEAHAEGKAKIMVKPASNTSLNDICNISVYKDSGIETISIDDIKVKIDGLNVSIENTGNYSAEMFSIDGFSITAKYSDDQITLFQAPSHGYYILRLGKIPLKVKL